MTHYRDAVAQDLRDNYTAHDGSQLSEAIVVAFLRSHRAAVALAERQCNPAYMAASSIAIREHLSYEGSGDDAEFKAAFINPPTRPAKPEPKPEPPSDRKPVTVKLTPAQATVLALSADEALRRGYVEGRQMAALERAIDAVRRALPLKEKIS